MPGDLFEGQSDLFGRTGSNGITARHGLVFEKPKLAQITRRYLLLCTVVLGGSKIGEDQTTGSAQIASCLLGFAVEERFASKSYRS